jgi:hypothetical protein
MPLLWTAQCTTCEEQGPAAVDEDDGHANDWCSEHNGEHEGHQALVLSIPDI